MAVQLQPTDTADGDVTISGSVIGTHGTDQDLIIDSGAGAVSIGSIGTVSENTHLRKIEINKGDSETGTIDWKYWIAGASGYAGADGAVYIGGINSGTVTLSGTIYHFDSTVAFQAAAGSNQDIGSQELVLLLRQVMTQSHLKLE